MSDNYKNSLPTSQREAVFIRQISGSDSEPSRRRVCCPKSGRELGEGHGRD